MRVYGAHTRPPERSASGRQEHQSSCGARSSSGEEHNGEYFVFDSRSGNRPPTPRELSCILSQALARRRCSARRSQAEDARVPSRWRGGEAGVRVDGRGRGHIVMLCHWLVQVLTGRDTWAGGSASRQKKGSPVRILLRRVVASRRMRMGEEAVEKDGGRGDAAKVRVPPRAVLQVHSVPAGQHG